MTASGQIRVFQTSEHACGYWPERQAQDIVLDPASPLLARAYPNAILQGFRRSGGHVYRPQCPACQACVPVRIPVAGFLPNRSQRRCEKRNATLAASIEPPTRTPEIFELYRRYLDWRHRGGGMDAPRPEEFDAFLSAPWSPTRFLALREQGRLLALAVTDLTPLGLSAVYTFFEPEAARRSLGTLAILRQLQWAARLGLPHLYLGFWLDAHPKMDYKRDFPGVEALQQGRWQPLPARAGADQSAPGTGAT